MIETRILRSRNLLYPLLGAALLLHGCGTTRDPQVEIETPVREVEEIPEWERTASPADLDRLNMLDQAWTEALGTARKSYRRSIAAQGKLLEPDAALARPEPAPGSYMCKLIQIGSSERRGRAYAASKPAFCYVGLDEEDRLWLAKQTGALRRQGFLWEDDEKRRMIFLGSLARGSKDAPEPYGTAPERDTAGIFERIGPMRYRLVTPAPKGFKLEILELTPAPVQRDE